MKWKPELLRELEPAPELGFVAFGFRKVSRGVIGRGCFSACGFERILAAIRHHHGTRPQLAVRFPFPLLPQWMLLQLAGQLKAGNLGGALACVLAKLQGRGGARAEPYPGFREGLECAIVKPHGFAVDDWRPETICEWFQIRAGSRTSGRS